MGLGIGLGLVELARVGKGVGLRMDRQRVGLKRKWVGEERVGFWLELG